MIPLIAMAVVSAVASAYSAYSSFQMAEYSKAVAKEDAKWKLQQGMLAQEQTNRAGRRALGETRAALAASGLAGGGTAMDLQIDQMLETAREEELARLTGEANVAYALASGREKERSHQVAGYKSILGGAGDALTIAGKSK